MLCLLMGCQTRLGNFVGHNQAGDAGSKSLVVDSGRERRDAEPDAGDAMGSPADGGDGGLWDSGVGDSGALDGAAGEAAHRDAASPQVDARTRLVDAGVVDAAGANSQAWPLSAPEVSTDAGAKGETPAGAVSVDGDISEWPHGVWTELGYRVRFAETSSGELTAVCAWQRVDDDLLLAVVVRDDVHHNEHAGFDIWKGDSVQVAFDVGQGRLPYDWEYGVALLDGELDVHRWFRSDANLGEEFPAAVVRWGDVTVYELRFAPERLGVESLDDVVVRASVAVNESDGYERTAALELTPGIVEPEKSKTDFVEVSRGR